MTHVPHNHEEVISRHLGLPHVAEPDSAGRIIYNLALQLEAALLREAALQNNLDREVAWGREQLQRNADANTARSRACGEQLYLQAVLRRISKLGEGDGLAAASLAQRVLEGSAALWSSEKPDPGVWLVKDGERYFLGRVGLYHHDPTGDLWFMGVDQPWQECTWPINESKNALWLRLPDDTLPPAV